jgi:hypothetical protein
MSRSENRQMQLKRRGACEVESNNGLLLSPAGLLKYKVFDSRHHKSFTFWCDFVDTPEGNRALIITIYRVPQWDDGETMSEHTLSNIAFLIGEGFRLKGYPVMFQAIERPSSASSSDEVSIHDTPGGKWLDEVSQRKDLQDSDRDALWSKALANFRSENVGSLREVEMQARPKPVA